MGFIFNYCLNLTSIIRGRQPRRPLLFSYYVTHRCNLNCPFCSDGDGKRFADDPVDELSTVDAKLLIDILSRSADTLDITGGEPLLRDDIEILLEHAQSRGMRTVINTNGSLLREHPDIFKYADVVVIGINALSPDRLSLFIGRPPDVAQKTINGLAYALSRRQGSRTKIVLSTVMMPDNIADVTQILEYAISNGLGFHASPQIIGARATPELYNQTEYRDLVNRILSLKNTTRGILGVSEYYAGLSLFKQYACHPLLMPTIRPDGYLYYPCLECKTADINVIDAGSYPRALSLARQKAGEIPDCKDRCHIFCHMALSLIQRHPISALLEQRHWNSIK